ALDGVANPLAHHALDGVRGDLAPFSRVPLPAIASHGVILRHPLPSGPSCRPTAPDDDAFLSLFHHTADIAHTQGHLGDYPDLSMARSFGPRSTSPPPCG